MVKLLHTRSTLDRSKLIFVVDAYSQVNLSTLVPSILSGQFIYFGALF